MLILRHPGRYAPWLFLVLAIGELAVPQWAEGAARGSRYWRLFHPEHIAERYGLFTIIVLGESVLSATFGIQEVATRGVSASLIAVAAGGLLIAFGAWWIYFDHPGHLTPNPELAMRWGYLHVVVFVSLAALGAGLFVAAEAVSGEAVGAHRRARRRVPVAGYLVGIVLLMVATRHVPAPIYIVPKLVGATVLVVVGLVGSVVLTVIVAAAVMVVMVVIMITVAPAPRPAR